MFPLWHKATRIKGKILSARGRNEHVQSNDRCSQCLLLDTADVFLLHMTDVWGGGATIKFLKIWATDATFLRRFGCNRCPPSFPQDFKYAVNYPPTGPKLARAVERYCIGQVSNNMQTNRRRFLLLICMFMHAGLQKVILLSLTISSLTFGLRFTLISGSRITKSNPNAAGAQISKIWPPYNPAAF